MPRRWPWASRPDRPRGSAGRDAAIQAAAAGAGREVAVTGLPGLPPRRFAAPQAAPVAPGLAGAAPVDLPPGPRGPAPPPNGHPAGATRPRRPPPPPALA